MWEYLTTTKTVSEYESFKGYNHKFDTPRVYLVHKIIDGKETIIEATELINTKQNKKTAKNFQAIVDAMNFYLEEKENEKVRNNS